MARQEQDLRSAEFVEQARRTDELNTTMSREHREAMRGKRLARIEKRRTTLALELEQRDLTLLSGNDAPYIKDEITVLAGCGCGTEFTTPLRYLMQRPARPGCPNCWDKRRTVTKDRTEKAAQVLARRGYSHGTLSREGYAPTDIVCAHGHTFTVQMRHIAAGRFGCKVCAVADEMDEADAFALSSGFEVMQEEGTFGMGFGRGIAQKRTSSIFKDPDKEYPEDAFYALVARKGGTVIGEYLGARTPVEIECCEGHRWSPLPTNLKDRANREGSWCPRCAIRS
ncbi:hypothetical protein RPALISO_204 [Ruegeria phage RpAliso]|nr:hypothetical protein RPALISO_204 [Ruegeria phage RpAliso]